MPHSKKITESKLKLKTKPWITAALQKSIFIKSVLYLKGTSS